MLYLNEMIKDIGNNTIITAEAWKTSNIENRGLIEAISEKIPKYNISLREDVLDPFSIGAAELLLSKPGSLSFPITTDLPPVLSSAAAPQDLASSFSSATFIPPQTFSVI
jgi:hypothetical protein